jgi:hypothetical protein
MVIHTSEDDQKWISPNIVPFYTSQSIYVQSSVGFAYDTFDYDETVISIISSSYPTEIYGDIFEAVMPEYVALPAVSISSILQPHDFVPRRNYYTSSSFSDDINDVTSFEAVSADYMAMPASISTLETIEALTTENVDPEAPPFPDPPSTGLYDLNRFRKTYTNVRVRPRVRKYSTVP